MEKHIEKETDKQRGEVRQIKNQTDRNNNQKQGENREPKRDSERGGQPGVCAALERKAKWLKEQALLFQGCGNPPAWRGYLPTALPACTGRPEARCLPLSESEEKRGSDVIPKCALCNGSKDES